MPGKGIIFCITLLLNLIAGQSWAHNLKGTIKSTNDNPIPYATVYVKEISQGTTTNADGEFELELEPGTYTFNFRCLGFVPKTQTIRLTMNVQIMDVILEEQIQQIEEVPVIGTGEDPADAIIRKVISLSYIHLNQINSYIADVYIRGTVKFENIPGIIRNQLRKQNLDVKSGDVLVNENVSIIKFHAPDKYDQQIKSINSTFPEEVDFQTAEFLGSSLYQENIDILFSPLGKNAFSYYKFTYEGFDYDKQYTVNKIRVTPKRKSKQFFEGYIYIIEGLWCLHRADLNFDTPFGKVNVRQVFDEVRPQIWLPVGHNYSFFGGLLGLKASAKFGASIKYSDLELNQQVLAMANYPEQFNGKTETNQSISTISKSKPVSKSTEKRNQKIEQILEKDKLSNQEMLKLSRLMAQKDKESKPDTSKSLELVDQVKVNIDKEASKRDTGYWTEIRPIPLSADEINSFRQRDSIVMIKKSAAIADSQKVNGNKKNFGFLNPLLFGKQKQLKDSSWQISYVGLFTTKRISFNSVDGLLINQDITFTKKISPGYSLQLTPQVAYAFSRKSFMAGGTVDYRYAPMRRANLQISGGKMNYDFNGIENGIHPFVNSIASLFFKENYARYYESRFINIYNNIDITNGLVLRTKFEWKDISRLENTTNFSFFNTDEPYSDNKPVNQELNDANINDQINATAAVRLEYTPKYYYRIINGEKQMDHSNFPTIYLQYEKGINNFLSSIADYDFIGTGIRYRKEYSVASSFTTEFHTGWFPNSKQIHFSDFAHAPTQSVPVTLKEYRHTFYLPGDYELSTSDQFIRAYASLRSPFIALKYLPLISNTLWREMVWTSYYTSPQYRNYVEVGYSLLEVLLSANVGIFAGFEDGKYSRIGFNIAFRWAN
jgi:hypothetical protein